MRLWDSDLYTAESNDKIKQKLIFVPNKTASDVHRK